MFSLTGARVWVINAAIVSSSRNATPENIDAIVANGMTLWNSIYEPHAVKLYEKLGSYHPDFICTSPLFSRFALSPSLATDAHACAAYDTLPCLIASRFLCELYVLSGTSWTLPFLAFIIQSYGSVLSPLPGGAAEQGNLSRALGSVVGVACLRAEGRVGPQLTSHVFGLLKARATEGLSEEDRWLASDEGTEWVIRTIDTLLDVVIAERSDPQEAT